MKNVGNMFKVKAGRPVAAFTLVEVAISLAIIGIALVGILLVLPGGMNVQRENREATIINQDASVFIEAIRNGSRGLDDLTNYVYLISVSGVAGTIDYSNFTSGAEIIGLMSTPSTPGSSITNRAYVRSMSGMAVEKPPQTNSIIRGGPVDPGDAFAYRILCENMPVQIAGSGAYFDNLEANLHELRLTFLWPVLPTGGFGSGRWTYRALVAGQMQHIPTNGLDLYFFQSQSFTNTP
jgi:type II secretory pathway pseudopilin PulG